MSNSSINLGDTQHYKNAVIVFTYIPPILIFVGTIGNVLSIIVLLRKSLRSSTTMFYLAVLSFGDLCVLYTGLLRWWISHAFNVDIRSLSTFSCKAHIFLVYVFLDFTVWILVAVTIDRCISVCLPFKSRRLCSLQKSRVVVVTCAAVAAIVNVQFFFTVDLRDLNRGLGVECEANESAEYFLDFAWTWINFCKNSFLPFIIMIVCNIVIVYKIISNQRKMRSHSKLLEHNGDSEFKTISAHPATSGSDAYTERPKLGQCTRQETSAISTKSKTRTVSSLTAMLLTVNCVFLCTTSPVTAFQIGFEYLWTDVSVEKFAELYFAFSIVSMLLYINNVIHFFLYCLTGPRVRRELRVMFNCATNRVSNFEQTQTAFQSS